MPIQKDRSTKKDGDKRPSSKDNSNKNIEQESKIAAINRIQAIAEFDMRGNILTANENFLNIFGYNLDEIQGRHHRIFVEDNYKNSREYDNFWDDLRAGIHNSDQYKRIGKGDKEVWIQGFYTPILNSNGRPVKVIKHTNNITEQKIKDLECDMRMTALDKSVAVIEFDVDGNITNANENFLTIMGYNLKEIQGKHHGIFVEESYVHSREYKEFWKRLKAGDFISDEYKIINKWGGEVWIQATYNPIFDSKGVPYKIIKYLVEITDKILELRNAEDQLKKSNTELECQNRLKSAIEEVGNSIIGELNVDRLCDNVLKKLAELIDIKIGAFYILPQFGIRNA